MGEQTGSIFGSIYKVFTGTYAMENALVVGLQMELPVDVCRNIL